MRWPWQRRETRAASFTDAVTHALLAKTSGTTGYETTTAITEACAGWWGRAFAAATVSPSTTATAALTPLVLAAIGRDLLLCGESLWEIAVNGAVELHPFADFEVVGNRTAWDYQVEAEAPDGSATIRRLPGEQVIHLRYAVDPEMPWKGLGPLDGASYYRHAGGTPGNPSERRGGGLCGGVDPHPPC